MSHCACELRTREECREGVAVAVRGLRWGSESCGEGEQLEQRDGRICGAEQLRDPVGWEVDTADSVKAGRRRGSGSRSGDRDLSMDGGEMEKGACGSRRKGMRETL